MKDVVLYPILYPNGEIIDLRRAKKLDIIYPDQKIHNIIVEYVEKTKNGKYILNYLEYSGEELTRCFTELNYIEGEWYKNPFHMDYEEYDFEPFDKELSDSIIEQLPQKMNFRILISPDNKEKKDVIENKPVIEEKVSLGAPIVKSRKYKNLFMVLPTNDGATFIDKKNFNFEFPFPVFSYLGETYHDININNSRDDINYDASYNEEMYLRDELSVSTRKVIAEYLKNDTSDVFDTKKLPILEIEREDENINICFITCPSIDLYNSVYKADKLFVDLDVEKDNAYDSNLERALHQEIPLSIELLNGEIKNNGIKHNKPLNDEIVK